jgi:hypothetical protein
MPDILPMRGRSSGIHLSDIIRDLSIRQGHFKDGPLNMARANLGNALEWGLIERLMRQYPERYTRIPEIERDGIFATLDLVDKRLRRPNEFKLTWMSSGKQEPGSKGFWKYEMQLAAQAHLLGSDTGVLPVVFAMGDYAKQREPQYREYEYQWVKAERERLWKETICRHRDRMIVQSDYWRRVADGTDRMELDADRAREHSDSED